jgi:GAF domain-containing protein
MTTFLGVPIVVRGQTWGNLYLADKHDGEFDEADEEAAVVLARWAAIAIENARLYKRSEERRVELEKALRGLEAARDITIAIGQESRLDRVLELIVKRGRALVEARSVVILLCEGDELVVAAHAGHAIDTDGVRLPIVESTTGQVMQRRRAERIGDVASRVGLAPRDLGVADARSALLVPLVFRDESLGVLAAFDRGEGGDAFGEDDEQVLRAFAAGAATAVATGRILNELRAGEPATPAQAAKSPRRSA